jgi:hypothetical protein
MRRLLAALSTTLVLAALGVVPAGAASADVKESIRIKTAQAVSYGDPFRHNESDPWKTYPFRPRMGVTTQVRCDAGKQAVVYYGPLTAHQGPQAGPFRCTGKLQDVTIFPAAGEVGPVRVHSELRYYATYSAGAVVASHQRNVRATDLQAFTGRLTAPAQVKKGEAVQVTGDVQHLTKGAWKPLGTKLQVRFDDGTGEQTVARVTSNKNGKVRFTTPPITTSGFWSLVWVRGGRDWATYRSEVKVTDPKPQAPAAPKMWIGTVTTSTADVHWTAPANVKNITGYRFGWTSSNGKPVPAWQGDWPANRRSPLTMTNLHPGTTYTMWVAALTPQGEGKRAKVEVTTKAVQLPSAPGFRVGTVTRTTAELHWTAPANAKDITGYRFGWTSSNGKPVPSWQGDWPANRRSPLTMINLHPGTTYTMWVAALTKHGEGKRANLKVTTRP